MAKLFELPVACYGHHAKLRVSPMNKGDWDVGASVEVRVAHVHCSDWNRVERLPRTRQEVGYDH